MDLTKKFMTKVRSVSQATNNHTFKKKVNNPTLEQFVNSAKSKKPILYKFDIHVPLLYEVFSIGESITDFCVKASIARCTFYAWVKRFPEFEKAVELAKDMALAIWETLPLTNTDINHNYWKKVMLVRFGYGRFPIPIAMNQDPEMILDSVIEGLKDGTLSLDEAKDITNIVLAKAKLKVDKDISNAFLKLEDQDKITFLGKLIEERRAVSNKFEAK